MQEVCDCRTRCPNYFTFRRSVNDSGPRKVTPPLGGLGPHIPPYSALTHAVLHSNTRSTLLLLTASAKAPTTNRALPPGPLRLSFFHERLTRISTVRTCVCCSSLKANAVYDPPSKPNRWALSLACGLHSLTTVCFCPPATTVQRQTRQRSHFAFSLSTQPTRLLYSESGPHRKWTQRSYPSAFYLSYRRNVSLANVTPVSR